MDTTHQVVRGDVAQQTSQTSVQTGGVHVSAPLAAVHTGLDRFRVVRLGDSEHGLFDRLVGERLEGVDLEEFLGNVGESRRRRVVDKVLWERRYESDNQLLDI